jgi:hypothetical protein
VSGSNALQITDPNASDNPLAQAPSWADAATSVGGAISTGVDRLTQWLSEQRAKSAKMGLWNDATGLPTGAGLVDAAGQYGNALLMGTTAPGEPSLAAAIRHNGKIYRAPDDNPTHFGALSEVPPDQRASAMGDANTRVYVTDRGKVLDRFKAADYARSFGIYDEGVPPYAATSPEYIAEWLPGYRAMLDRIKASFQ